MNPDNIVSTEAKGLEDQTRSAVSEFEQIVDGKLVELSPSLKSGKLKAEHDHGGLVLYYERNIRDNFPVFAIEEPNSAITYEFIIEGNDKVRRNILDNSKDRLFKKPEKDTLVATRVISIDALIDLVSFMQNPDEILQEGIPETLVGIDPEKDTIFKKFNPPDWNKLSP